MTFRLFSTVVWALLAAGLNAPVMASAQGDELRATLSELAKDTSRQAGIPGIIILVDQPSGCLLVAHGSTMRQGGAPVNGSETLRLGSITKTYMAALALLLAREGHLDLDRAISSYLPRETMDRLPRGLDPSIRQLLNHSSGIPDYYSERFYREDWKRSEPLTPALTLHAIRGLPATSAPGARFEYSNTNYQVLSLVIERATGQTIAQLLQDRLMAPLGLKSTYYSIKSPPGDVIHGYGSPFDPWEETFAYRENSGPDGGMFATASDVAKLLRALFAKDGALSDLGRAMIEAPLETGLRKQQGMGIEILSARSGQKVLGHTGSIDGYLSAAYYLPSTDSVLVIHANRSDEQAFASLVSRSLKAIIGR